MMTTREYFTFEDPTVIMTTPDNITNETTGSSVTSSSSRGASFYFQCAVVIIGVVGMAANGLVLYALVVSKEHKRQMLIFNQNLLDIVSCLGLSIMYGTRMGNIHLDGMHGYLLCLTVLSEGPGWGPMLASVLNLGAITTERYLKIVHSALANKILHNWMIYLAMAFSWIGGLSVAVAVTISTSDVVNGICYTFRFWKSRSAQTAYIIWYFLSFVVIILLIFIILYWRILMAIRHQARVMASHNAAGSTAAHSHSTQDHRIQVNVIKTMMLVSTLFALTWTPLQLYYFLGNVYSAKLFRDNVFSATVFLAYLNPCTNPFIYATKFEPVKRVLYNLIPWKKTAHPPVSVVVASSNVH